MATGPRELLYLCVAVVAGALGAMVGVGGGVILVPVLTFLGVDVRLAAGASLISVIATSSGATAAYARDRLMNLRVAIFLGMFTAAGALVGALLQGLVRTSVLNFLFAGALILSALGMLWRGREDTRPDHTPAAPLDMAASYVDPATGRIVRYGIRRLPLGSALMFVAGSVSGLLGIGSGALKVPAMDLVLDMPMKASSATSDFMIGVTAAASVGAYYARGQIVPGLVMPVALGASLGSFLGSRLLARLSNQWIRIAFLFVLAAMATEMIVQGVRAGG